MLNVWEPNISVVIAGGGFTGTLLALAAAAAPRLDVVLVERSG